MPSTEEQNAPREQEDWEKHYLEQKNKTLDQKREDQIQELEKILENLNSLFEQFFLTAVKHAEGEKLSNDELDQLKQNEEAVAVVSRLKGLRERFGNVFYASLNKVTGQNLTEVSPTVQQNQLKNVDDQNFVEEQKQQTLQRLPKGFRKWDLKAIKLHESLPKQKKRTWIEYWSHNGDSAVGEVLFNKEKELLYFRAYDFENHPTFPLIEDSGRKVSWEGRNYYFRKAVDPPTD